MSPLDRLYDEKWYKIRNSNKLDFDQRCKAADRLWAWYQEQTKKAVV